MLPADDAPVLLVVELPESLLEADFVSLELVLDFPELEAALLWLPPPELEPRESLT